MRAMLKNPNLWRLLVVDGCLLVVAYFVAHWLRFEEIPPHFKATLEKTLLPLALIKLSCFALSGLYAGMWRYISIRDILRIVGANLFGSALFATYLGLSYQFLHVSRGVVLIDFLVSTTLIASLRGAIRLYFVGGFSWRELWRPTKANKRLLVIGAGDSAEKLVREVHRHRRTQDCHVVGFLDDDPKKLGLRIHGTPVLGATDQIDRVLRRFPADEILIAISRLSAKDMKRLVRLCADAGLPYKVIPGFAERVLRREDNVAEVREVRFEDLLGREPIALDDSKVAADLSGKRVLVTGAGGSIGSELCRQICKFDPERLILLDISEFSLYRIDREIGLDHPDVERVAVIGDVVCPALLEQVFEEHRPEIVFHAAAYKHVPLVEQNPLQGMLINTIGTHRVARVAARHGTERFVFVSTDKAVRPRSVLGASKRAAEAAVEVVADGAGTTRFTTVRFGNVVGSTGSVVPLFLDQIAKGGPLTVTHPDVERYFMSIPEAVYLILEASALRESGQVFVLEMGQPVRILDVARELIRLKGFEPEIDIPIRFVGLRPGEKLSEELLAAGEHFQATAHPKIKALQPPPLDIAAAQESIQLLERSLTARDTRESLRLLATLVPEYVPSKALGSLMRGDLTQPAPVAQN